MLIIFSLMNAAQITIKTQRLILRPWRPEDLEPFAKLNADPRVREFFPSILTREESDRSAEIMSREIKNQGWGFWAVSAPGVADFIGMIGIDHVHFEAPFTPAVEIGWRLSHEFWGKGYATEGAYAALQFAFDSLHLDEVVAFTAVKNRRSRAVMEKLGMHHTPADDFDHPKVPDGNPVKRQVLYRIKQAEFYGKKHA